MKATLTALSLFVLMITSIVHADYPVFPVTDSNAVLPTNPVIDGNRVIWEDSRYTGTAPDILGYSFSEPNEIEVCVGPGEQSFPAVSGDIAAWYDVHTYGTAQKDIYGYNLHSRMDLFFVSNDGITQKNPDVDGIYVVYEQLVDGVYNIYFHHIDSGLSGVVESASTHQLRPSVSVNRLVWGDGRDDGFAGYDIYVCDLSVNPYEAFPVNLTDGDQWDPAISGDIVAWREMYSGTVEIVAYDLSLGQEVLRHEISVSDACPAVSDGIVVWHDDNGSDYDIYGYDTAAQSLLKIATEPLQPSGVNPDDRNPSISGRRVVWQRSGAGIVYADITPSTVLRVDTPAAGQMYLAGSEMTIQWSLVDGAAPSYIDIEFLNSGSEPNIAEDVPFGDMSYTWHPIADVNSIDGCRIRISDVSAPTTCAESGSFSIFQCDTALTADLTGDCFVDIADFAEFAAQWLTCGNLYDPAWCIGS